MVGAIAVDHSGVFSITSQLDSMTVRGGSATGRPATGEQPQCCIEQQPVDDVAEAVPVGSIWLVARAVALANPKVTVPHVQIGLRPMARRIAAAAKR